MTEVRSCSEQPIARCCNTPFKRCVCSTFYACITLHYKTCPNQPRSHSSRHWKLLNLTEFNFFSDNHQAIWRSRQCLFSDETCHASQNISIIWNLFKFGSFKSHQGSKNKTRVQNSWNWGKSLTVNSTASRHLSINQPLCHIFNVHGL